MKVLIGVSGGVDSSVAAAMLKKQGYDVTGVFLLTRNYTEKEQSDAEDVRNICEILDIPLKIIDARKGFRDSVVKYFLDEYGAGRTPNPCVFCNENFKFKILFEIADEIGADYVATGHYARIISNSPNCLISNKIPNSKFKIPNKFKIQDSPPRADQPMAEKLKTIHKLFVAKDEDKDQSYFLYRLKQGQLKKIIFPLGEYRKIEVRAIAKKIGLPVSGKKESQDVCFLRGSSPEEFLRKNLKMKKGTITDIQGNVLGGHLGLSPYTIGQRKGIKIGGIGPYYVIARDFEKNVLVVSNKKAEVALYSKKAKIEKVSWVASAEPTFPLKTLVRTRYRNPLVCAIVKKKEETCLPARQGRKKKEEYEVEFEKAERAVTAGQSIVFYSSEGEVIGGGIIG
ncbi:MAG: tRNA-specific 2-thiouridylase MnmA [Patescibacteria group bacterium]|nr:tRNA-specific 2-thiouridylase MnmA [Patescibacteria group bacterium]